jgi:two-component sensor histidine kinase
MQLVLALRQLRHHPWLGHAVALAAFILAVSFRYVVDPGAGIVPFITLFPAILIAALVGGLLAGLIVTALSAVAALYWFIPPIDSLVPIWPAGYVAIVLFLLTSAIQLYAIEMLNRTIDALVAERDQSAIMFQELQHRVANNMQFVAGLLRMQSRNVGSDPDGGARALEDAKNRLETMARIHRLLYDPAAIGLPLGQYFQKLCTDILDATGAKNVVCVAETPPVTFDLRRLVTLSLIVNEVITNSLKHAFDKQQQGTISIMLERQPNNRYALTIKDNGRGLPANFDFGQCRGLGARIINGLAEQLGGELSFDGTRGMTTRLVFPA